MLSRGDAGPVGPVQAPPQGEGDVGLDRVFIIPKWYILETAAHEADGDEQEPQYEHQWLPDIDVCRPIIRMQIGNPWPNQRQI